MCELVEIYQHHDVIKVQLHLTYVQAKSRIASTGVGTCVAARLFNLDNARIAPLSAVLHRALCMPLTGERSTVAPS